MMTVNFNVGRHLAAKRVTHFLSVCVGMLLLAGCTNIKNPSAPVPENFALENRFQKHMQSSQHWKIVAEDLANQMQANIRAKKLAAKPLYLNMQTNLTPFTRAFHDFLITSLVKKGIAVSTTKAGSRVYNYKIQLVEYQSHRGTLVSDKIKWTALAAGLVVVRQAADVLNIDGGLLSAGAVLDVATLNFAPNLEIIITSSLLEGDIFIARSSDIYYANETDIHLYRKNAQGSSSGIFDEPFYKLN